MARGTNGSGIRAHISTVRYSVIKLGGGVEAFSVIVKTDGSYAALSVIFLLTCHQSDNEYKSTEVTHAASAGVLLTTDTLCQAVSSRSW